MCPVIISDTDGLKVTNYKGKEDGVTDFANSHGDSQKKDHERFRDTKRKNKGRRVSVSYLIKAEL